MQLSRQLKSHAIRVDYRMIKPEESSDLLDPKGEITMSSNPKQSYFPKNRLSGHGSKAGRLFLIFLELQIPMVLGALVCYLVSRLVSGLPGYALIYHPGTYLYGAADILFLT